MLDASLVFEAGRIILWEDLVPLERKRRILRCKLQEYSLGQEELEVVTRSSKYESCIKSGECYILSQGSISVLIDFVKDILVPFRDMSIYTATSNYWIMCMIFHEEMVLVRDSGKIIESLDDMGVDYSLKAPSWW